jgi:hypothetical protein
MHYLRSVLFRQITSTCFEQAYCSSSEGTAPHIQQLVCQAFTSTGFSSSTLILLAASRHKPMTYTNCCIYRIVPPDDEQ